MTRNEAKHTSIAEFISLLQVAPAVKATLTELFNECCECWKVLNNAGKITEQIPSPNSNTPIGVFLMNSSNHALADLLRLFVVTNNSLLHKLEHSWLIGNQRQLFADKEESISP